MYKVKWKTVIPESKARKMSPYQLIVKIIIENGVCYLTYLLH